MPGQQNTVDYGGKPKEIGPESAAYMGVDLGQHLDFGAIAKLVAAAIAKLPPGDRPDGDPEWSCTIVVHPQSETGSAFILQPNPYKTWRWAVALALVLTQFLATAPIDRFVA